MYDVEQNVKVGVTNNKFNSSRKDNRDQIKHITTIILFVDNREVVHREFLLYGWTVYEVFYNDVLEKLQKRVE